MSLEGSEKALCSKEYPAATRLRKCRVNVLKIYVLLMVILTLSHHTTSRSLSIQCGHSVIAYVYWFWEIGLYSNDTETFQDISLVQCLQMLPAT